MIVWSAQRFEVGQRYEHPGIFIQTDDYEMHFGQPFLVLREATLDEYNTQQAQAGAAPQTVHAGTRFYEISVD